MKCIDFLVCCQSETIYYQIFKSKMETCAVQIGNPSVLSKIESFFNDAAYREAIESSATYNTRLCIERRLRMPFLDSQTGVAQNHSNLFMSPRERLPGMIEGQIYTYPSKRWRKKRRQYLMNFMQPRRKEIDPEVDLHTISTVENPAVCNEDSKDSVGLKDESSKAPLHRPRVSGYLMPEGSPVVPEDISKSSASISSNCAWDSNQKTSHIQDAWYYDELDMQEIEAFDDPDPDSDYDYEESYTKRKKKTKKPTRNSDSPAAKKPKGQGRGRKKANYDAVSDAEKPFACELCGARYKTRPGLTYHYTHSHKDEEGGCADPATASAAVVATSDPFVKQQPQQMTPQGAPPSALEPGGSARRGSRQNSTTAPNTPAQHNSPVLSVVPPPVVPQIPPEEPQMPIASVPPVEKKPVSDVMTLLPEAKERATPSPYCDFCLGDAQENKKTGHSEELVSCSDCGRSGHPTCLQFTPNMIISVRKYRWQCIECKCCSICGTSDNDDQLLFCDDCDRGYHMYCLAPPLVTPPEGSWSCRLCLVEFHNK